MQKEKFRTHRALYNMKIIKNRNIDNCQQYMSQFHKKTFQFVFQNMPNERIKTSIKKKHRKIQKISDH